MKETLLRTDKEITDIYMRHRQTVYRVCYAYMKNPADTEDAVQDTFVQMIRKGPVFENQQHEKAWLIRTAKMSAEMLCAIGGAGMRTLMIIMNFRVLTIPKLTALCRLLWRSPINTRQLFIFTTMKDTAARRSPECSAGRSQRSEIICMKHAGF
ncbi:MAG: hypothetical protein IIZ57_03950 [Solobacterium sp.]|nr:hypothetical protein [Solobacterium sp.]